MSYAIVYAPDALARLEECIREFDGGRDLVDCFEAKMALLAESPTHHSKPSPVPLPKGQSYDFHCQLKAGRRVHFRVHFLFRANESDLFVFDVKARGYIIAM